MDTGYFCVTAWFIFPGVWFVVNIITRIIRKNRK